MKIHEVRAMRTVLDEIPGIPMHESLCRAYHIVEKVKELLDQGTPGPVVLELIEEMECGEVSRGGGASYEQLAGDLKGVNYSSAKG